jgi:NADPH:quinone reductase-like Zn-dependent oxidoreductase
VLEPNGTLALIGAPRGDRVLGPLRHVIRIRLASMRSRQRAVFFIAKPSKPDLAVLRELAEAGKVTPAIERQYKLSEIADALRYLGEGHAQGKLGITM